jgi:uncharacterized protein YoaH (UPF0181 family)
MKHELENLIELLHERDQEDLDKINGFYGAGMTIENRISLADRRAADALAAIKLLARYIIKSEEK